MRKRKWLSLLIGVAMVMTMLPATVLAEGDDPVSDGLCPHHTEHTAECGYRAAQAEIPCDCTDTDGDGVTDHAEDCAYTPAVDGQPCAYSCPICPVQALIDALPEADSITEDNADEVGAKLDEIDETAMLLTDDELDALDFTKYDAAAAKLNELAGQAGAEEPVVLDAETGVSYLDQNGTPATCTNATEVTADYLSTNSNKLTTGWYVVQGAVSTDSRITVSGTVHLILADDCTLTASKGITVQGSNSLTIYGQANGTGTLTAGSDGQNASIGSMQGQSAGTITINGGIVNATGNIYAAGIGGGQGTAGGTITINGGTVKATGGNSGVGIGGGQGTAGGTITINGGTVIATGGDGSYSNSGAGIGGNSITISGGTVTATGGTGSNNLHGGAGIHSSSTITISGGTVKATGGSGGPYGKNGAGIDGSFSTGDSGKAVIFASSISDQTSQNSWGGVIFVGNDGKVYGTSVTPTVDFTIPSDELLLIPTGSTLDVSHITAVNNGSVYVNGSVSGLGGDLYYPLFVTGGTAGGDTSTYLDKVYGKAGGTITLTGTDVPVGQAVSGWTSGENVVNNPFTMPASALTVTAQYVNAPTYTVTIPASVTLGDTATISASGVNVVLGSSLVVTLTDAQDFKLKNDENVELSYSITKDSTALSVGSTVLTVMGGTANASGNAELTFSKPTTAVQYSGYYKGNVTFTVSVETVTNP